MAIATIVLLAACGGTTAPVSLSLDRLEQDPSAPQAYILFGEGLRGDAEIFVCETPATNVVIRDAAQEGVPATSRDGISASFRLPDLGTAERDCDIAVVQIAPSGTTDERAELTSVLVYLPTLALERVEPDTAARSFVLFGTGFRGDTRVLVCNTPATLIVVRDESGEIVPETGRSGVTVSFRGPDLGTTRLICDVEVAQTAPDGTTTERRTLVGAFVYVPPGELEGVRVLLYASIYAGEAAQNPRARFNSAVRTVEQEEQILLTIVDGSFDEYIDGEVAKRFETLLQSETWDVVAFLEEQWNVPQTTLKAVADYVSGGGRALGSYWRTFDPDSTFGNPARAFAAAFSAGVTPEDNVEPIEDGRIDISLRPPLTDGLTGAYSLINNDYYVLSYAQRLTPLSGGASYCSYLDATGGSCAVANAADTTLFLGFTLAPLSESMTGAELETFFRNALRFVVLSN